MQSSRRARARWPPKRDRIRNADRGRGHFGPPGAGSAEAPRGITLAPLLRQGRPRQLAPRGRQRRGRWGQGGGPLGVQSHEGGGPVEPREESVAAGEQPT